MDCSRQLRKNTTESSNRHAAVVASLKRSGLSTNRLSAVDLLPLQCGVCEKFRKGEETHTIVFSAGDAKLFPTRISEPN
ncbi:MAG: hypothetical protein DMG73_12260 [Acidobacteria bacterium]|nr:MAG: hypothetical protein DMG73_12260 [Acidobacteriota bacterium]